jgi:hypothetical protein
MKMPLKIENDMLAPCGINCMVCYKHCNTKKPCQGCLLGDAGKPEHCRKCNIKKCGEANGYAYCFECANFPCKFIKNLEKSYNKRYNESLITNSLLVKDKGINAFMVYEKEKWTCTYCGSIISLHDGECSECKSKFKHKV